MMLGSSASSPMMSLGMRTPRLVRATTPCSTANPRPDTAGSRPYAAGANLHGGEEGSGGHAHGHTWLTHAAQDGAALHDTPFLPWAPTHPCCRGTHTHSHTKHRAAHGSARGGTASPTGSHAQHGPAGWTPRTTPALVLKFGRQFHSLQPEPEVHDASQGNVAAAAVALAALICHPAVGVHIQTHHLNVRRLVCAGEAHAVRQQPRCDAAGQTASGSMDRCTRGLGRSRRRRAMVAVGGGVAHRAACRGRGTQDQGRLENSPHPTPHTPHPTHTHRQ